MVSGPFTLGNTNHTTTGKSRVKETEMIGSQYKALLHVHMENAYRMNRLINKPIDFHSPGLLCNPSASVFFETYDEVPVEHKSLYNKDILFKLILQILYEQAQCNVIYAEFRFSPIHWNKEGVNFEAAIDIITKSTERAFRDFHIKSGCIICFDRSGDLESIETIIDFLEKHNPSCIVGVDFAGDEKKHSDISIFENVINRIKNLDLGLTIHAGEFGKPENIWAAIERYGATRIGHGIAAAKDRSLIDYLASKHIMLEISLTSNVVLNSIKRIEDHPVKLFLDAGVPISINTDNPVFLGTNMTKEFSLAINRCGLSLNDLNHITRQSIIHSFAKPGTKKNLLFKVDNKGYIKCH